MAQHRKGPTAKEIALERIAILFDQAYQNRADPVLADRYVAPAREIAMRRRLRMPREYRRFFCPVCHTCFVPGEKTTACAFSTGRSSPHAGSAVQ
ncbi:ribonuclease P protein component 4 [Methanocorpusculum vombati]|uniref:Uncharacterized protein n=1 Tax=Methanocorpusculum vombati TaxID=3002864 RepID=A0ABT4IJW8_9EURY|nr:hypothetical protein [Methanocorpusculum vombati]MCZ9319489.1 hypothetical protein [Methanocorpusculum sp.]MCZ0862031.1 hypothetical protein [Methanocorpusculum vombati]MDE2520426.1 hypothetical protein [Methanocorpusculum sp.]MDE2534095.1 hypothetical protein [Methanocorpusculum sp.]MDE2545691.1 hypothetical protein [Methanocorpusculum sp.]